MTDALTERTPTSFLSIVHPHVGNLNSNSYVSMQLAVLTPFMVLRAYLRQAKGIARKNNCRLDGCPTQITLGGAGPANEVVKHGRDALVNRANHIALVSV